MRLPLERKASVFHLQPNRDLSLSSVCHLGSDGAFPDQVVDSSRPLKLVLRCTEGFTRWANRFVGFLSAFAFVVY